jgi:hypothetical protein
MVITSRILQDKLGIHPVIADYFANQRQVPADNLFWKDKRIYLSVGFGFLTIPFAFDVMHKRGIPLETLLEDQHVSLMEAGFDRLKHYENRLISIDEFILSCKTLLEGEIKQHHLASDLFAMFSGKTPAYFTFESNHKALARSDFFLFTLADIDVSDDWVADFLPYWYAIARPILLLDDFRDLAEDRISGDENTIIELGNDRQAIEAALSLGDHDLKKLSEINEPLSVFIRGLLNDALKYEPVRSMMA